MKIVNWFTCVVASLFIAGLLMIIGVWDYVTMRNNEDTRFD